MQCRALRPVDLAKRRGLAVEPSTRGFGPRELDQEPLGQQEAQTGQSAAPTTVRSDLTDPESLADRRERETFDPAQKDDLTFGFGQEIDGLLQRCGDLDGVCTRRGTRRRIDHVANRDALPRRGRCVPVPHRHSSQLLPQHVARDAEQPRIEAPLRRIELRVSLVGPSPGFLEEVLDRDTRAEHGRHAQPRPDRELGRG